MPIVKTVEGDLLALFKRGDFEAIVHGCNCFHTMGAGIAAQIAKQFPDAYWEDEKTPYGEVSKLGTFSISLADKGLIYNAYTQYRPGREDRKRLYDSIERAFKAINEDAESFLKIGSPQFEPLLVGIPRIGAGLAGGDWDTIKGIIDGVSPSLRITLVDWKP